MHPLTDLLWVPIDVPPIQFKQELINSFNNFYPNYAREAQRLTTKSENYSVANWIDNPTMPQHMLMDYIDHFLPFDKLVNIKIQRLYKEDVMHYDYMNPDQNPELYKHNTEMEPCGYRFVLSGTRQGDLAVVKDGKNIFPVLPDTTDCYLLGHTSTLHGCVNFKPDRYIVFCHAWINKKKHYELLERSLTKYGEYAVWK